MMAPSGIASLFVGISATPNEERHFYWIFARIAFASASNELDRHLTNEAAARHLPATDKRDRMQR
jgi:hypothetical protein